MAVHYVKEPCPTLDATSDVMVLKDKKAFNFAEAAASQDAGDGDKFKEERRAFKHTGEYFLSTSADELLGGQRAWQIFSACGTTGKGARGRADADRQVRQPSLLRI